MSAVRKRTNKLGKTVQRGGISGNASSAYEQAIRDLRQIPGVGISIANDLWNINIKSVQALAGKDPESVYDQSNKYAGVVQDRCMLYVFRCAVYFAETPPELRDPEKLKWWNWK